MNLIIRKLLAACAILFAAVGYAQKFEIELEEEDLVDIKKWVDPTGHIVLDVSFDTHNHYFYLLGPNGKVISRYKNFYQNIFYKGFTSNEEELTVYFSTTPKGEIYFLDFFKNGKAPLVTEWSNVVESYFNSFSVNGTQFFLTYEKKKSELEIAAIVSPVAPAEVTKFTVDKELAREVMKLEAIGMDYNQLCESHYGANQAYNVNGSILLLNPEQSELNVYRFDFKEKKVSKKTFSYPEQKPNFWSRNDSFVVGDKVFLMTINSSRLCLNVFDTALNMLKQHCIDENSELTWRSSPVVDLKGRNKDQKWSDKDNLTSKILNTIALNKYGYLSVLKENNGGYSIILGGETQATPPAGTATMTGMPFGLSIGGGKSSALVFCMSLDDNLDIISGDTQNYFDKIIDYDQKYFNNPYIFSKNLKFGIGSFFYSLRHNWKELKLELEQVLFE